MATKTSTEVVIGGKSYNLSGYEEPAYLETVASYINQKLEELSHSENFGRIPAEMRALMIQLNLADDVFKARTAAEKYEKQVRDQEKELYELRQKIVAVQLQADEKLNQIELVKAQNVEFQAKIEQLEHEKHELENHKAQLQKDLEDVLLK